MKLTLAWTPCALSILLVGLHSLSPAYAADPNKQARCAKYAQRTVEQYNLMQSHPQCRVSDDMSWNNNLDGHYNGCMLLPEFMARAGEAARDNHLLACGASAPASPAPQTLGAAPDGSQNSVSSSATTAGASSATSQMVARTGTNAECERIPARLAKSLQIDSLAEVAFPHVLGDTLSFNDSRTLRNFKVRRPAFYGRCMEIAGLPSVLGPWIWISDNGREAKFFDVIGAQLKMWSLSPSAAVDLLKN